MITQHILEKVEIPRGGFKLAIEDELEILYSYVDDLSLIDEDNIQMEANGHCIFSKKAKTIRYNPRTNLSVDNISIMFFYTEGKPFKNFNIPLVIDGETFERNKINSETSVGDKFDCKKVFEGLTSEENRISKEIAELVDVIDAAVDDYNAEKDSKLADLENTIVEADNNIEIKKKKLESEKIVENNSENIKLAELDLKKALAQKKSYLADLNLHKLNNGMDTTTSKAKRISASVLQKEMKQAELASVKAKKEVVSKTCNNEDTDGLETLKLRETIITKQFDALTIENKINDKLNEINQSQEDNETEISKKILNYETAIATLRENLPISKNKKEIEKVKLTEKFDDKLSDICNEIIYYGGILDDTIRIKATSIVQKKYNDASDDVVLDVYSGKYVKKSESTERLNEIDETSNLLKELMELPVSQRESKLKYYSKSEEAYNDKRIVDLNALNDATTKYNAIKDDSTIDSSVVLNLLEAKKLAEAVLEETDKNIKDVQFAENLATELWDLKDSIDATTSEKNKEKASLQNKYYDDLQSIDDEIQKVDDELAKKIDERDTFELESSDEKIKKDKQDLIDVNDLSLLKDLTNAEGNVAKAKIEFEKATDKNDIDKYSLKLEIAKAEVAIIQLKMELSKAIDNDNSTENILAISARLDVALTNKKFLEASENLRIAKEGEMSLDSVLAASKVFVDASKTTLLTGVDVIVAEKEVGKYESVLLTITSISSSEEEMLKKIESMLPLKEDPPSAVETKMEEAKVTADKAKDAASDAIKESQAKKDTAKELAKKNVDMAIDNLERLKEKKVIVETEKKTKHAEIVTDLQNKKKLAEENLINIKAAYDKAKSNGVDTNNLAVLDAKVKIATDKINVLTKMLDFTPYNTDVTYDYDLSVIEFDIVTATQTLNTKQGIFALTDAISLNDPEKIKLAQTSLAEIIDTATKTKSKASIELFTIDTTVISTLNSYKNAVDLTNNSLRSSEEKLLIAEGVIRDLKEAESLNVAVGNAISNVSTASSAFDLVTAKLADLLVKKTNKNTEIKNLLTALKNSAESKKTQATADVTKAVSDGIDKSNPNEFKVLSAREVVAKAEFDVFVARLNYEPLNSDMTYDYDIAVVKYDIISDNQNVIYLTKLKELADANVTNDTVAIKKVSGALTAATTLGSIEKTKAATELFEVDETTMTTLNTFKSQLAEANIALKTANNLFEIAKGTLDYAHITSSLENDLLNAQKAVDVSTLKYNSTNDKKTKLTLDKAEKNNEINTTFGEKLSAAKSSKEFANNLLAKSSGLDENDLAIIKAKSEISDAEYNVLNKQLGYELYKSDLNYDYDISITAYDFVVATCDLNIVTACRDLAKAKISKDEKTIKIAADTLVSALISSTTTKAEAVKTWFEIDLDKTTSLNTLKLELETANSNLKQSKISLKIAEDVLTSKLQKEKLLEFVISYNSIIENNTNKITEATNKKTLLETKKKEKNSEITLALATLKTAVEAKKNDAGSVVSKAITDKIETTDKNNFEILKAKAAIASADFDIITARLNYEPLNSDMTYDYDLAVVKYDIFALGQDEVYLKALQDLAFSKASGDESTIVLKTATLSKTINESSKAKENIKKEYFAIDTVKSTALSNYKSALDLANAKLKIAKEGLSVVESSITSIELGLRLEADTKAAQEAVDLATTKKTAAENRKTTFEQNKSNKNTEIKNSLTSLKTEAESKKTQATTDVTKALADGIDKANPNGFNVLSAKELLTKAEVNLLTARLNYEPLNSDMTFDYDIAVAAYDVVVTTQDLIYLTTVKALADAKVTKDAVTIKKASDAVTLAISSGSSKKLESSKTLFAVSTENVSQLNGYFDEFTKAKTQLTFATNNLLIVNDAIKADENDKVLAKNVENAQQAVNSVNDKIKSNAEKAIALVTQKSTASENITTKITDDKNNELTIFNSLNDELTTAKSGFGEKKLAVLNAKIKVSKAKIDVLDARLSYEVGKSEFNFDYDIAVVGFEGVCLKQDLKYSETLKTLADNILLKDENKISTARKNISSVVENSSNVKNSEREKYFKIDTVKTSLINSYKTTLDSTNNTLQHANAELSAAEDALISESTSKDIIAKTSTSDVAAVSATKASKTAATGAESAESDKIDASDAVTSRLDSDVEIAKEHVVIAEKEYSKAVSTTDISVKNEFTNASNNKSALESKLNALKERFEKTSTEKERRLGDLNLSLSNLKSHAETNLGLAETDEKNALADKTLKEPVVNNIKAKKVAASMELTFVGAKINYEPSALTFTFDEDLGVLGREIEVVTQELNVANAKLNYISSLLDNDADSISTTKNKLDSEETKLYNVKISVSKKASLVNVEVMNNLTRLKSLLNLARDELGLAKSKVSVTSEIVRAGIQKESDIALAKSNATSSLNAVTTNLENAKQRQTDLENKKRENNLELFSTISALIITALEKKSSLNLKVASALLDTSFDLEILESLKAKADVASAELEILYARLDYERASSDMTYDYDIAVAKFDVVVKEKDVEYVTAMNVLSLATANKIEADINEAKEVVSSFISSSSIEKTLTSNELFAIQPEVISILEGYKLTLDAAKNALKIASIKLKSVEEAKLLKVENARLALDVVNAEKVVVNESNRVTASKNTQSAIIAKKSLANSNITNALNSRIADVKKDLVVLNSTLTTLPKTDLPVNVNLLKAKIAVDAAELDLLTVRLTLDTLQSDLNYDYDIAVAKCSVDDAECSFTLSKALRDLSKAKVKKDISAISNSTKDVETAYASWHVKRQKFNDYFVISDKTIQTFNEYKKFGYEKAKVLSVKKIELQEAEINVSYSKGIDLVGLSSALSAYSSSEITLTETKGLIIDEIDESKINISREELVREIDHNNYIAGLNLARAELELNGALQAATDKNLITVLAKNVDIAKNSLDVALAKSDSHLIKTSPFKKDTDLYVAETTTVVAVSKLEKSLTSSTVLEVKAKIKDTIDIAILRMNLAIALAEFDEVESNGTLRLAIFDKKIKKDIDSISELLFNFNLVANKHRVGGQFLALVKKDTARKDLEKNKLFTIGLIFEKNKDVGKSLFSLKEKMFGISLDELNKLAIATSQEALKADATVYITDLVDSLQFEITAVEEVMSVSSHGVATAKYDYAVATHELALASGTESSKKSESKPTVDELCSGVDKAIGDKSTETSSLTSETTTSLSAAKEALVTSTTMHDKATAELDVAATGVETALVIKNSADGKISVAEKDLIAAEGSKTVAEIESAIASAESRGAPKNELAALNNSLEIAKAIEAFGEAEKAATLAVEKQDENDKNNLTNVERSIKISEKKIIDAKDRKVKIEESKIQTNKNITTDLGNKKTVANEEKTTAENLVKESKDLEVKKLNVIKAKAKVSVAKLSVVEAMLNYEPYNTDSTYDYDIAVAKFDILNAEEELKYFQSLKGIAKAKIKKDEAKIKLANEKKKEHIANSTKLKTQKSVEFFKVDDKITSTLNGYKKDLDLALSNLKLANDELKAAEEAIEADKMIASLSESIDGAKDAVKNQEVKIKDFKNEVSELEVKKQNKHDEIFDANTTKKSSAQVKKEKSSNAAKAAISRGEEPRKLAVIKAQSGVDTAEFDLMAAESDYNLFQSDFNYYHDIAVAKFDVVTAEEDLKYFKSLEALAEAKVTNDPVKIENANKSLTTVLEKMAAEKTSKSVELFKNDPEVTKARDTYVAKVDSTQKALKIAKDALTFAEEELRKFRERLTTIPEESKLNWTKATLETLKVAKAVNDATKDLATIAATDEAGIALEKNKKQKVADALKIKYYVAVAEEEVAKCIYEEDYAYENEFSYEEIKDTSMKLNDATTNLNNASKIANNNPSAAIAEASLALKQSAASSSDDKAAENKAKASTIGDADSASKSGVKSGAVKGKYAKEEGAVKDAVDNKAKKDEEAAKKVVIPKFYSIVKEVYPKGAITDENKDQMMHNYKKAIFDHSTRYYKTVWSAGGYGLDDITVTISGGKMKVEFGENLIYEFEKQFPEQKMKK